MFYRPIPSTDLYFLNACRAAVSWRRGVRRLGSNTFQCGDRIIVVRRDKKAVLKRVLRQKGAYLIYVLDDDIESAADDHTLPDDYRKRLLDMTGGLTGEILERADLILASSQQLLNRLSKSKAVERIDPYWGKRCPIGDHFDGSERSHIDLVHMGTASHQAALGFLKPVVAEVLRQRPNVVFNYFSNTPLLGSLDESRQVRRSKIVSWRRYQTDIGNQRFHLALYPILDTPFNKARSCNKITEQALTGCAGIYSDSWEHAHRVIDDHNGWLVANKADDWVKKTIELVDDPDRLRRSYQASRAIASQTLRREEQRRLWNRLFFKGKL